MARPDTVTEEDIQEYIDGRASPALRADVETFLAVRPHRKAEVQALIRQQEALRRLGTEILAEPIPERLQEILRRIPSKRGQRPFFFTAVGKRSRVGGFSMGESRVGERGV